MNANESKWIVERYGRGFSVVDRSDDNRVIADCKCRSGADYVSCHSNALLLAAAPDLAEACREAVVFVECCPNPESNPLIDNLLKQLRAALAKAEGADK